MNKKLILLLPISLFLIQNTHGISVEEAQSYNLEEQERKKNELPKATDQGSLAHERWTKFDKIKVQFESYKNIHEKINSNSRKMLDTIYFKSIKEKLLEYYASLIIIEELDKKYFDAIYQGKNSQSVYLETIAQLDYSFIQCINQSIYSYLSSFEKKHPTIINKIEFYSWFKAYFPSMNNEYRAGFEPAHYFSDSFDTLFSQEIFKPFLLLTENEKYDFKISEISFGEHWNNANLKPSLSNITTQKKFQFKFSNSPQMIEEFLNANQYPSLKIIASLKYKKSLTQLKLSTNDFYSSILKLLNSTPNKSNILNSKKNSAITNNLIWSQQFNTNYLQPHKITSSFDKNCLTISDSNDMSIFYYLFSKQFPSNLFLNSSSCSITDKSQDWIIVFEKMRYKGFRIYSAMYPGYCLEEDTNYSFTLNKCDRESKKQIWIYNKLPTKLNALINSKSNKLLQITDDINDQTWMFQYKKSNLDHVLYYLINKKYFYTSRDWYHGNKIKRDLPFVINAALFINKYNLMSHSDHFFNKIILTKWFQNFDYKTKEIIIKIAKNKFYEISEDDIIETYQKLNSEFKSSNSKTQNNKNLILKNMNEITLNELIRNSLIIHSNKKPKKIDKLSNNIQNSILEINNSLLRYNNDEKLSPYKVSLFQSYVPLYIVPNEEEAVFDRLDPFLRRFFDMVDECDHWLPDYNNGRMPTYRQVWDNWSNGSWDPDAEFQQLLEDTSEMRTQLTPNQFTNIFKRIHELTLRDYSEDEMSSSSFDIQSIETDLSSLYEDESELSFWSTDVNSPIIFEPDDLIEPITELMEDAEYSLIDLESFINANEITSFSTSLETTSVSTIMTIIPTITGL
ncbi:RICIN domain-containing protein [Silvanigrella aquatica]|uniref:Uncharacterized protein n=1 Tax=Silvanigrella aquatica TaxID=1915309 RepID=A0A1L4CZV6_9BACT|nr:RICIN domain-containing protein [Silvanigrella aquatica]APJ03486.1 hypothetical protein AXG55_06025 [Silvanigrella aquatica]